jgi:hypothetical protein
MPIPQDNMELGVQLPNEAYWVQKVDKAGYITVKFTNVPRWDLGLLDNTCTLKNKFYSAELFNELVDLM